MKTILASIFILIIVFTTVIATSEFFAKRKATKICSEVKIGMTNSEVSRLAEVNGIRPWQENNEIFGLGVTGGMGSAYFCRIEMNNGGVKNVLQIRRMPGG